MSYATAWQNINAFIQLLKNQKSLFSDQDNADLNELLNPPLPDNIEKISEKITVWCENRTEINEAREKIRSTLCRSRTKPSNIYRSSDRRIPPLTTEDKNELIPLLENAIRRNASPPLRPDRKPVEAPK